MHDVRSDLDAARRNLLIELQIRKWVRMCKEGLVRTHLRWLKAEKEKGGKPVAKVELMSKKELNALYDDESPVFMSPIINALNEIEPEIWKPIMEKWKFMMGWSRWHSSTSDGGFHKQRKFLEQALGKPCDYTGTTSGGKLYKIWGLKINDYPVALSICSRGTGLDVPAATHVSAELTEMFIDEVTKILIKGKLN